MTESLAAGSTPAQSVRATRQGLHVLLSLHSLLVVLVSVNRMGGLTTGFVAPNEFMRWVDLINMALGLAAVLLYYALVKHLQSAGVGGRDLHRRLLDVAFIVAAYLYAASFGNHEITNYLHGRFCSAEPTALCRIIVFNDDEFSHLLFFAGFIGLNVVVMLAQVAWPDSRPLTGRDNALVVANALVIAAAVVANLAFEEIGLDLYVVGIVAALAILLLRRRPGQAVLRYYSVAFAVGWIASVVVITL